MIRKTIRKIHENLYGIETKHIPRKYCERFSYFLSNFLSVWLIITQLFIKNLGCTKE